MTNQFSKSAKVRIFTSHAWRYGHRRERLHEILSPWVRDVDFEDYSVSCKHPLNTETDPQLADELCNRIVHMDALLILAGMFANRSPWMQFEINAAFALRIPIIPILANGQKKVPRLSTRLASCEPVRWRGKSIRESLLSCVGQDRRVAIEAKTALRIAAAVAAAENERQRQATESRRLTGSSSKWAPLPQRPTISSEYSNPRPTNYLADILRRRYL